ncbi:MAG: ABC transporter ATP-binding protein [Spirochaetales bacterium]|nr:ABC transporter ATP-binding protein [Spirochaetales bacterium]
MDHVVELREVRKEYKEFVLDGISWQIPKGCIMGLIGPNGAGKTTTIKIIMNLIRADGGKVSLFGLDYRRNEKEIKNRIGYVGEEQYFYEDRTVAWTGRFVSRFYRNWDTNTFSRLLNEFQISGTKKVKELSKGMRVKLSIALALSHNPELIILDEPTAGLDPVVRRELLDLLRKISSKNKSVIISSHITDDIARTADYITYLLEGRISLIEQKDELLSNWKKIHFRTGTLDNGISSSFFNIETSMFGSSGITNSYLSIKDDLAEGIRKEDIKVENVGLDDILICFVKGR